MQCVTRVGCSVAADVVPDAAVRHAGADAGRARQHALPVVGIATTSCSQPRPAHRHCSRRRGRDTDQGTHGPSVTTVQTVPPNKAPPTDLGAPHSEKRFTARSELRKVPFFGAVCDFLQRAAMLALQALY